MSKYEQPEWHGFPLTEDYFIEVVKDGVVVDKIVLSSKSKSYYMLGRQKEDVDIWLENPTASREHAVLQWNKDGSLMCIDLNSAQGTFLNKTKLKPNVFHKIHVGDILRFAQSNRMYIINGPDEARPPEYESENLLKLREILNQKSIKQEKVKEVENNNKSNGISWGFAEDAPNEDSDSDHDEHDRNNNQQSTNHEDDDEERFRSTKPSYMNIKSYHPSHSDSSSTASYSALLNEKLERLGVLTDVNSSSSSTVTSTTGSHSSNINKHKSTVEKIRTKELKIVNLTEEMDKIQRKELSQQDGLTAGQQDVLKRNEQYITQLKSEIDDLVYDIKATTTSTSSGGKQSAANKGKKRGGKDDNDNDDEMEYDTTRDTIDASTNWRMQKKTKLQKTNHTYVQSKLIEMDLYHPAASHTHTTHGSHGSQTHSSHSHSEDGLTYECIREKLTELQAELKNIQNERIILMQSPAVSGGILCTTDTAPVVPTSSEAATAAAESDSDFDALLLSTQTIETKQKIKRLELAESTCTEKISVLERLLKILTPALSALVHTATTAASRTHPLTTTVAATATTRSIPATGTGIDTAISAASSSTCADIPSSAFTEATKADTAYTSVFTATTSGTEATTKVKAVTNTSADLAPVSKSSSGSKGDREQCADEQTTDRSGSSGHTSSSRNSGSGYNDNDDNDNGGEHDLSSSSSLWQQRSTERKSIGPAVFIATPLPSPEMITDSGVSGSSNINNSNDSSSSSSNGGDEVKVAATNKKRPSSVSTATAIATALLTENSDAHSLSAIAAATATATGTTAAAAAAADTLQGGDHVWKAPKNQTGDGKTWLNQKFGY